MLRSYAPLLLALPSVAVAQNDECTGALPLPLGATAYDTTAATTSGPLWPCATGGTDLWYLFTAPNAGSFTISTCNGSGYDTALEAFTGSCAALVPLICNDDSCGLQSRIGFLANAGDQIYVRVGGFNGAAGFGTLEVAEEVPVLNPANGHYYQVVTTTVDWPTADQIAQSFTYQGLQGHLVTISDAAEDQFVYFTLAGGALGNAWLGAYQDMSSPTYSEPAGGWTWVTGEPFIYTNWYPGEPNNSTGGQEHYLGYWPADQWNDYAASSANVARFVVEYESSSIGTSYCTPAVPNSTGGPSFLRAEGSTSVAANTVTLVTSSLPPNAFGFYLTSMGQGMIPGPGGSQGTLCLGGAIGRYVAPGQIMSSGPQGELRLPIDLTRHPTPAGLVQVQAGQTWRFQCWHRDANPNVTSNFSDAVAVTFVQ
jgi:hypothetical protein